jgi:hypothetical protein
MDMRHDQQKPHLGFAENQASSNELDNAIYKLRLIGFKDEAASLGHSAHCRELLEFLARQLKAHIDLAEPIPERLAELIEQLTQRINERERRSKEG